MSLPRETTKGIYSLDSLKEACNRGRSFTLIFFYDFKDKDIQLNPVTVGCLSQFFPIQFSDESGVSYSSSVQYMSAHKALLFDDRQTADRIMREKNPLEIIQLGRKIKNFGHKKWDECSEKVVFQGNLLKFSQNKKLSDFLLSFPVDSIFVNADPNDSNWGIQMSEDDHDSLNLFKWRGSNKLGFQITRVRDQLLESAKVHIKSDVTTIGIYSLNDLKEAWSNGVRFSFVYFWLIDESKFVDLNESCFCQWFPSDFIDEKGVKYCCCEQYMMAQKAMMFKDEITLRKIMDCNDPHAIKKLGREVKNFVPNKWDANSQEIVYHANLLKFSQNENLKRFMLSFPRSTIFVEASPYDAIWGIKLKADDPQARDPFKWKGTNFLGFQLTRLRDYLIQ